MKVCTRCLGEKPPEDFAWNGRGGRRPVCRPCTYAAKANTKSGEPKRARRPAFYEQRDYIAKVSSMERFLSADVQADGPCWCCRMPARGKTEFRLCIVCGV